MSIKERYTKYRTKTNREVQVKNYGTILAQSLIKVSTKEEIINSEKEILSDFLRWLNKNNLVNDLSQKKEQEELIKCRDIFLKSLVEEYKRLESVK